MLYSIAYIILAFIPQFIYIIILSKIIKNNIKSIFVFFIGGIYSIGLLLTFLRTFPSWNDFFIDLYYHRHINDFIKYVIMCFIQIALIEELCKYCAFKMCEKTFRYILSDLNRKKYAIFCASTALGFSFIENIDYAYDFGYKIIFYRSITSSFVHFICGFTMGYLIYGLKKRIKRTFIGILSSTSIHGLYDFIILYYTI